MAQVKVVVSAVVVAAVGAVGCAGTDDAGSDAKSNAALVRPMPSDDTLCKLHVGTPLNASGFRVYGTHVEDVEGVWGAPTERSGSSYVYMWSKDKKDVRTTLTFETAHLCYRKGGAELKPGMFLKQVSVEPSTEMRECWKPDQANTNGTCGSECVDTSELQKCE